MRKYQLPSFLEGVITQAPYQRWLHRKAMAHVKRDRKRGNEGATNEEYKLAIHRAVEESQGKDTYTDEPLDWTLLSTYDNDESKTEKATLVITGMHCNSCAMLIEGSLRDAAGVTGASVDFKAARAVVEYDTGKTNPAIFAKLVRDMGYGASVK